MTRCSGTGITNLSFRNSQPPDDLVLINGEVEALLDWLGDDRDLPRVLKMRLEEYTVAEIAEQLKCASRTIERRLHEIRTCFLERRQRPSWLARLRRPNTMF